VVLPRLQTLLDTNEPLRVLNAGGAQDALWRRYAAERGLPAEPVRIPIHSPAPVYRLPARSQTAERLARVQQALELVQTAVDTASTLAAAYQHWQIGREQRKLLEAQRFMLHDTIQAQISGQERALDRGLDRAYVRGYLADHAGDAVVDVLFGGDVG
jgi:hypothetical protein